MEMGTLGQSCKREVPSQICGERDITYLRIPLKMGNMRYLQFISEAVVLPEHDGNGRVLNGQIPYATRKEVTLSN